MALEGGLRHFSCIHCDSSVRKVLFTFQVLLKSKTWDSVVLYSVSIKHMPLHFEISWIFNLSTCFPFICQITKESSRNIFFYTPNLKQENSTFKITKGLENLASEVLFVYAEVSILTFHPAWSFHLWCKCKSKLGMLFLKHLHNSTT